ncbi:MAG: hypothetical protein ACM3JC_17055 [Rudaea sp.]
MANAIVVGTYASRTQAEAARGELVARGIASDCISVEQRDSASGSRDAQASSQEAPGFAGVVARMFSGALLDEADMAPYVDALSQGHYVVAVRTGTEHQTQLAAAALARGGPRTYSLPNAPTAWNEATRNDPASMGGVDQDPGRPEGLLRDAEGLPARTDEAGLEKRSRMR